MLSTERFGLILAFLWGIGTYWPYTAIYIRTIGPADFLFLTYSFVTVMVLGTAAPLLRTLQRTQTYALVICSFVALGLTSSIVNGVRFGIVAFDLIEALRPLYYLAIVVFTAFWVEKYGPQRFVTAFASGIALAVATGYVDSYGSIQIGNMTLIQNSNVYGNITGVGIAAVALLMLRAPYGLSALLLLTLTALSVASFSKGAWLMTVLGLAAAGIAFARSEAVGALRTLRGGWPVYAALAVFSCLLIYAWPQLTWIIELKVRVSELGSSASEGGGVAARWGMVIASLWLVMQNPFLGIGISNYERAYDQLRDHLGANFHPTDNPHSAYMYVLACLGIPAFALWAWLFLTPFFRLWSAVPLRVPSRILFIGALLAIFALSAAVQIQILAQHFFWVFTGIAFGWNWRRADYSAAHAI